LNSKNGLSTSTFVENEFKIQKTSLFAVFFTAIAIVLLVLFYFLQLIIFYYSNLPKHPGGMDINIEGNRIEYIDPTTGKHCVEYTDNNSGEDCSEFK